MDEIFATYKALEPMPEFKESKKETNNESQNTDVFNLKLFEKTQSLIDNFYKTDKTTIPKKEVKTETNIVENNPSTKKDFTTNYNGNNNIKTIFSFLIQKGLTKEQAAGIAGNIIAESGGNPKAYNKGEKAKGYKGYGRGIVQWSNERVNKFEEYMGVPILEATLWQQLEYMWHEMEERPAFMEALLNSKTIEEATDAMLRGYENGSKNSLISIEKYNSIYKNNSLNGHSYEDSLTNRVQKSLSVYKTILTNNIISKKFGGILTTIPKFKQGGSASENYLNTLKKYVKTNPKLLLSNSDSSVKTREWLRNNNREDLLVDAYKNTGITDRAKMPLVSSTYWQEHPVGGKHYMDEVNELHKIPTFVLGTVGGSAVAEAIFGPMGGMATKKAFKITAEESLKKAIARDVANAGIGYAWDRLKNRFDMDDESLYEYLQAHPTLNKILNYSADGLELGGAALQRITENLPGKAGKTLNKVGTIATRVGSTVSAINGGAAIGNITEDGLNYENGLDAVGAVPVSTFNLRNATADDKLAIGSGVAGFVLDGAQDVISNNQNKKQVEKHQQGGKINKYQQGKKFWNYILDGIKTMSDPQTMGTSYMNSPAADPKQAQEAGKKAFDATTAGDVYNLGNAIHNKDKSGIVTYAAALAAPAGLDLLFKGTRTLNNLSTVFQPGKIVYGHPGIGKTYALDNGKTNFVDWDTLYNRKRDEWIANASKTEIGTPEFKKARNEYLINPEKHPDYIDFLSKEWDNAKNVAKQQGKTLVASPHTLLKLFPNDFDAIINLNKKDFIQRNVGRGGKEKESALWKQGIDRTISKTKNIPTYNMKEGEYLSDALGKVQSEHFNTDALDLSKVDYEIYDRSKTKGYNNKAIKISIKDNPDLGYFELVKDNEPGYYSVHFKTGNADTGKTFGSTPEQRQLLYEQIRNVLPEGAKISTWGNISEGGVKALNKIGKGYTNVGTRKINDRYGNEVTIPIFQKNTRPASISTLNQLIPENQAPEILQNILPKRNKYGLYSSKDLKKINEAKQKERLELLYGRTPLNYFYKEGVDFIRRNPTEEELLSIKERNLPRIDQMRPGRTDTEIKEGHNYIIDRLKKVNVVEYSENMMGDYNKINKGPKAIAFSLSQHPAIAITKNSPTTKIDAIHELRHQMQNMFTRTDVEQDLFKKAFGDFKYRDDYDIDIEYETMTTDARNSALDWCKKEWGDKYANGSPIKYSDIIHQNHLINNISDQDFIKVLYKSDGYWANYLNQILDKYGYIPSDKIKAFKEVITKTGMIVTPLTIGATRINSSNEEIN